MKKYNRNIDVIIPAYNVPDEILFRCLASIACQDIISDIEVPPLSTMANQLMSLSSSRIRISKMMLR